MKKSNTIKNIVGNKCSFGALLFDFAQKKTNGRVRSSFYFDDLCFFFSFGNKLIVKMLIGRDYFIIPKLLSRDPCIVVMFV